MGAPSISVMTLPMCRPADAAELFSATSRILTPAMPLSDQFSPATPSTPAFEAEEPPAGECSGGALAALSGWIGFAGVVAHSGGGNGNWYLREPSVTGTQHEPSRGRR